MNTGRWRHHVNYIRDSVYRTDGPHKEQNTFKFKYISILYITHRYEYKVCVYIPINIVALLGQELKPPLQCMFSIRLSAISISVSFTEFDMILLQNKRNGNLDLLKNCKLSLEMGSNTRKLIFSFSFLVFSNLEHCLCYFSHSSH